MKKGTIYRVLWAGHETYFVYQGSLPAKGMHSGVSNGYGLMLCSDGKWIVNKRTYYTHDLENDREHFPVVGQMNMDKVMADMDKVMTDAILSAIGRRDD